jgi:hypothetical protein
MPCYSADFGYYSYSIKFDPEDFGVKGIFYVTRVVASADISEGMPVPFIISTVSPQDYPDSASYRGNITFSTADWDTFMIHPPLELNDTFWVTFSHSSQLIPFALSEPEEWDPDRNMVESTLGWGPISCDMAVGAIVETELGIEGEMTRIPIGVTLDQNYPNPFNPMTTICFSNSRRERVELAIYSLRGMRIETLVSGILGPGHHSILWKGDETVPSGVYFYQLQIGEIVLRRKMFLSK